MASIGDTLETKLKEALKSKDARATSVLRMLKTALVNERISKMHDLSDEEETAVIRREVKKREDSIQAFSDAGRTEQAAAEAAEAAMLKDMLPPEMTDDQLREIIAKVVAEQGKDNFGKVMGAAMKAVGSGASGDRVSKIVKEEINK